MSQFSLIPYNAHSQNLSFRSKETTATDNKCSLFLNIVCEMALEIFNAFGFFLYDEPLLSRCRYQQKSPIILASKRPWYRPLFYYGYILVESLSLFITYFAKVREKKSKWECRKCIFKDIRAPNCSYAFSMSSTISAYCS